jgi:hypothetical protein
LKSKYRCRCTKVPQNVFFVTITALMVSTRKQLFSSVHRAFVIENTLSIAALVPGMAKEYYKMSCMFFNEIHSLHTNLNISDQLSKIVSDFVFHSSILVLLILQCEQIHTIHNTFQFFKNLLHGERGQNVNYNGFTFCSTTWKLFLMHSSYHWECTIHGSMGMVVLCFCVEWKQSLFGCNFITIICKENWIFMFNFAILIFSEVWWIWELDSIIRCLITYKK